MSLVITLLTGELVRGISNDLGPKEFKEYIDDYYANPREYNIDTLSYYYAALCEAYAYPEIWFERYRDMVDNIKSRG